MYTAAQIAEFSLRFAGVLTPYDLAADSEAFNTALEHFNLLLAEITGTKTHWWWVPVTQEFALTVGESEYELDSKLSNGTPLLFVRDAHLKNATTGRRERVDLIRRWQFDEEYDPDNESGTVTRVYVERKDQPMLYVLDTPTQADTLVLTGVSYPQDVTDTGGDVDFGFPDAWMRYLALRNAVDIGAGPVVALPSQRHDRLAKMALQAERRLNAYNNREQVQQARHTKPRDF